MSIPHSVPVPDHSYVVRDSPRSAKRKLDAAMHHTAQIRKRLKYSNAKVQRLKRKVKSLSEVVESLKKNSLISSGCEEILRSTFSSVPFAVMQSIMKQKSAHPTRASYPDELKSLVGIR